MKMLVYIFHIRISYARRCVKAINCFGSVQVVAYEGYSGFEIELKYSSRADCTKF